jgi:hypothetical protein
VLCEALRCAALERPHTQDALSRKTLMANRREFHLIPDSIPIAGSAAGGAGTPTRRPLVIPDGLSYLAAHGSRGLRVTTAPPANTDTTKLLLEPLWRGQQSQLLLVCPGAARVRVNGRLAPALCLVSEQDQFQVDEWHVLHVSIHLRPEPGPPRDDRVGGECPICRTLIGADTRVHTCLHCGTPLHYQGEETPPDERLECALTVSSCPVCRNKLQMTAGYSWTPELYCE